MMKFGKNLIVWLISFVLLTMIFGALEKNKNAGLSKDMAFSDFMLAAENNEVAEVTKLI